VTLGKLVRRQDWPVAVLVVWLTPLAGFRVLTSPEEARYGSIAVAMVRSGDWATPMLNGLPFLDKPPLYYWIDAAALIALPYPQWALRAAPLLGAFASAWLLWRWLERRCGAPLARWTLLVLATMPLFFGGAQFANMDMLVAGCIAVSVCCAAAAMTDPAPTPGDGAGPLAAWIAAALGVLAKGLIGLLLPVLIILVWSAATRHTRSLGVLLRLPYVLVFLSLVLPWHLYQQWQHPGFAAHYLLGQHFGRFTGTGFNNARAWWFYLAAIPLLTLPWSLWLPRAAWPRPGKVDDGRGELRWLMWIWLTVVTVFFSIPESKPPGYAMPALFPIAFLVADAVLRTRRRWLALTTTGAAVAASLAYVVVPGLTYEQDHRALAITHAALSKPGDPVAFVGDYYYDVPIYAALDRPARVAGDWSDPGFSQVDDWRRELAQAASFAPSTARQILLRRTDALSVPCGRELWVVAPPGAERHAVELARGTRIHASPGAVLWRLGGACP
jgi:4-amino-4-deoxy-L-arabinose transferase-like glycosyltransferase